QHDQACRRAELDRQRQDERHGSRRSQSGQDADDRAEHRPDETREKIRRSERDEEVAHGRGTPSHVTKITRLTTVIPSASAAGRHQPASLIKRDEMKTRASEVAKNPTSGKSAA